MSKRTNFQTKVMALILTMVMVISLFPTGVMAASNKGPSNGFCFIRIEKSETDMVSIFFPQAEAVGTKVEKVSGFSYDKKTNTLTIKNVKKPKWVLNVNEMGTDFKIKLVGTNELYGVTVWGFGYGGSVEFTGTGRLTLNKSKTRSEAITMQAEQSKSVLKVGKKVTLNAYAGTSKNSVTIYDSTIKKASDSMVFSNGASTKKVKTKKDPVVKTGQFAFQMDFGDAGVMEYSSSAILLSKKGSKKQYATIVNTDPEGGWLIYEISGDIGEVTNLPIAKLIGNSDDYEKDGYKATVTGYVYTHTYSGNLLLKAK